MEQVEETRLRKRLRIDEVVKELGITEKTYYNWKENPESIKGADLKKLCKFCKKRSIRFF